MKTAILGLGFISDGALTRLIDKQIIKLINDEALSQIPSDIFKSIGDINFPILIPEPIKIKPINKPPYSTGN